MARVFHRKARKDYPDNGVKKGDMYYYTKIKTGPYSSRVMRQLTPFKRSQLTSSPFYSAMYEIEDTLSAAAGIETVRSVIDELESLRDETQESLDNMPEGLQYSHTGEMLQERIDGCETAIDELTDICNRADDVEPYDPADDAEELSNRVAEGEDPEEVAAELAEEASTHDELDELLEEARDYAIEYP